MPTAEKAETIEQAKGWYAKASGIVFTDYKGLKVKEVQALRADLRKKGAEFHVLKNTLFRIAAGNDTAKLTDDLHNGTTGYAFVFENEAEVTKALLEYARVSKKLVVKGGFFGGQAVTAKQVEAISQLPPKEVLISQVIGAIAAPLTTLIGTIEALYADPIRVIGAVADKVAESSPIPESAPVAEVASPEEATPATETAPVAEAEPESASVPDNSPATEASPEPAAEAEASPS